MYISMYLILKSVLELTTNPVDKTDIKEEANEKPLAETTKKKSDTVQSFLMKKRTKNQAEQECDLEFLGYGVRTDLNVRSRGRGAFLARKFK